MLNSKPLIVERLLLLACMIGPFYGKSGPIIIDAAALLAFVEMVRTRRFQGDRFGFVVAAVFFFYTAFFILHGMLVTGDIFDSAAALRLNLPIPLAGVCALYLSQYPSKLDATTIGRAATWAAAAVHVCSVAALVLKGLGSDFLYQSVYLASRLQMFSQNALMFASMMSLLSFLCLLGFRERSRREQIAAIIICYAGLIEVLVFARSRGSIIPIAFLVGASLWYLRFTSLRALSAIVIVISIGLIVPPLLIKGIQSPLLAFQRSIGVMTKADGVTDMSTSERVIMYSAGIEAIIQQPIIGYGYANRFAGAVPYMERNRIFTYRHLHNDYITHAVAAGIPGLLVFLLFLATPFLVIRQLSRPSRDLTYFAFCITSCMAGTAVTTAVIGHYIHASFYASAMVLLMLCSRNLEAGRDALEQSR